MINVLTKQSINAVCYKNNKNDLMGGHTDTLTKTLT